MRALALLALAQAATLAWSALPPLHEGADWRFVGIAHKTPTRFAAVELDGAPALRIEAEGSYGNLVHALPAGTAAGVLQWQWQVEQRNDAADLTRRGGDDTTLKVCALFDLPDERVPFVERQLLRIARKVSGEPLPAAVLCYVWDAALAPGSALDSPYSRRVRYLIARGPEAPLQRWLDERHDLAADFRRLFGDESPDALPPLTALVIGADADNTHARSVGFVRALRWSGAP